MRSFRLGGTIGFCAPSPYRNFGSLELSSRVTICGSVDVTEEIVGISIVLVPDRFVEFTIFGERFRCGLGLLDSCSSKRTSGSIEFIEILEPIFELFKSENTGDVLFIGATE